MARTSTHLANKALQKLKKVGLGQAPDAEDTQKMLEAYPSLVATLSSEDIYTISDDDDISDDAFEWLALYLAYIAAPDFSEPQDDGMRQVAEYHLKLIGATRPTYEVMQSDHF